MANVYVGFHDQRNSSRVLKPPGGGTSSLFGGDLIPDVVPHSNNCRKEAKHRGSSIQDVLRTESTVTTTSKTTSTLKTTSNEDGISMINESSSLSTPDVAADIVSKMEHFKVEETSSEMKATETDQSGETKVLFDESKSEKSIEQDSAVKQGSSIGLILNEDDLPEKKKKNNNKQIKGQTSPNQRVPPGGFSSGLW